MELKPNLSVFFYEAERNREKRQTRKSRLKCKTNCICICSLKFCTCHQKNVASKLICESEQKCIMEWNRDQVHLCPFEKRGGAFH